MIERINPLEMFGKSEGLLSEKSETYFGALIYMLACGCISEDPCWAESNGAHKAVKDTLKFLYNKFSDTPSDTVLSEFNSICRMVCYEISITDYTMFRRCRQRTDYCMEDVKDLYDGDTTFKSFITRVKNVTTDRGSFSGYVRASLSEIRDIVLHGNCGIVNFVDIVMNFLNERDTSVAIHNHVSGLIKANFASVEV